MMGFGKWSVFVLLSGAATGSLALPVGDIFSDFSDPFVEAVRPTELAVTTLALADSFESSTLAGPGAALWSMRSRFHALAGGAQHVPNAGTGRQDRTAGASSPRSKMWTVYRQDEADWKPYPVRRHTQHLATIRTNNRYNQHYGMLFGAPDKKRHSGKGHVISAPGNIPGGLPGSGFNPVAGGGSPELTPVPIPAGLPLMALGLGALAYLRKRATRS